MKTRSTFSAAALLAVFSGLALVGQRASDAAAGHLVRVRVALPAAPAPPAQPLARGARLTAYEVGLLRSPHTPTSALRAIASRQQHRRELELKRLTPAMVATGRRLLRLAHRLRRFGARVEQVDPLSGSVVVAVAPGHLASIQRLGAVTRERPRYAQTGTYTSPGIGAPSFWGAGLTGGRGSGDVNPTDLYIAGDVVQQSHPAFEGVAFSVPTGAPHGDPGADSHGTGVADMAVGQSVVSCPAGYVCDPADLGSDRKGAAYGVDKVINVPNSWGTSGQPGESFSEYPWGVGITQVGSMGTVLNGAPDPAEVVTDSAVPSPPTPDDSISDQRGDGVVSGAGVMSFQSAGNYGPSPKSVGCVAYDTMCIGAFDPIGNTNPADDTIPDFSSRGPTLRGRKKPDLVAVGVTQFANSAWSSSSPVKLWKFGSGTSYSSPQAAGAALLLLGSGLDPLSARAVLIDSARQGRATPASAMGTQTAWQPDWGWGAVDMTRALAERTNYALVDGRTPSIASDDAQFYSGTTTTVGDRATLVWNRRVNACPWTLVDWSCSVSPYPLTNLNLAEYAATGDPCATPPSLRDASTSAIDNVEQVRSSGPDDVIYKVASGSVSGISAEPYAMASTRQTTRLVSPKPQVTVSGAGGMLGPGQHATVTITATNPSGTMTGCAPVLELSSDDAAMQITAGPAPAGPLTPGRQVTRTFDIASTTHGVHTLSASASDTAYGSTLTTTAIKDVVVDAAGPQASITVPDGTQPAGPVAVSWAGADPSGVENFDVEASVDGAAWTGWLAATQQTAAAYPGEAGHGYRFRVRATDRLGNAGPWAESVPVAIGAPSTGPGPGPGPDPRPDPPRVPFSARLSLPILSRTLSRMTIKGTTTRKATGSARITFKVRVAGTTTSIAKLATMRGGAFTVSLKLPGRVRRWRTGTLSASYAGNSWVKPGSATRRLRRTGIRVRPVA
jgi:Subtilase family